MERQQGNYLSIFSLVMITVVSVDSIRNLPTTALFGSALVFFFLLATLLFLVPCALVAAQLSSGTDDKQPAGIYSWLKEAFDGSIALTGVWFQWVENVLWYPTILAFIAGTIGYLLNPELANHKLFIVTTILCIFWGMTLLNLRGMVLSARISDFCAIAGLLIPMALIIGLGATWFFMGKPLQIELTPKALLPDIHNSDIWRSLTGIMLSFCGIELAAVHARDVKNPQSSYPKALFYATAIITGTLLFGALSIAIILPHDKINLIAGIMQASDAFSHHYHMRWLLPVLGTLLIIGLLGSVNSWIIAPTRGLLIAAQDGLLPKQMSKENQYGAPQYLLICQAIIVSFLTLIFLLIPSVNGSYWLLTVLASQLYMGMYLLMFAGALYLRWKKPQRQQRFTIPGGLPGLVLVCTLGIIACIATLAVGFIPPTDIPIGSTARYELLLLIGLVLLASPPFILHHLKKNRVAATGASAAQSI